MAFMLYVKQPNYQIWPYFLSDILSKILKDFFFLHYNVTYLPQISRIIELFMGYCQAVSSGRKSMREGIVGPTLKPCFYHLIFL